MVKLWLFLNFEKLYYLFFKYRLVREWVVLYYLKFLNLSGLLILCIKVLKVYSLILFLRCGGVEEWRNGGVEERRNGGVIVIDLSIFYECFR